MEHVVYMTLKIFYKKVSYPRGLNGGGEWVLFSNTCDLLLGRQSWSNNRFKCSIRLVVLNTLTQFGRFQIHGNRVIKICMICKIYDLFEFKTVEPVHLIIIILSAISHVAFFIRYRLSL